MLSHTINMHVQERYRISHSIWMKLLLLVLVAHVLHTNAQPSAPVASTELPALAPITFSTPAASSEDVRFVAPFFPASRPLPALLSINNTLLSAPDVRRYIVVLKKDVDSSNMSNIVVNVLGDHAPSIQQIFISAPPAPTLTSAPPSSPASSAPSSVSMPPPSSPHFAGFSIYLTNDQLHSIRSSPSIQYIEEDGLISLAYDTTGSESFSQQPRATIQGGLDMRSSPLYCWGLDRIDQRYLPLDGIYAPRIGNHGHGVTIYLIDTGCRTTHREFDNGRATLVYTRFSDDDGREDRHGHGTHTAATAGGKNVGVANQAKLACLAVLDETGTGTYTDVITAMQWVQNNAVLPAVMSMSLGGSYSQAINDAATALMKAGVVCVSASGNSASDSACSADPSGISPASTPSLIVAASINASDMFSAFDNHGACVTVLAPGEKILSAWGSGDAVYAVASGTSMSCPHVAGIAALYLAAHNEASHNEVRASISGSSTKQVISLEPDDTPDRLLYSNVQQFVASSDTDEYMIYNTSSMTLISNTAPLRSSNTNSSISSSTAQNPLIEPQLASLPHSINAPGTVSHPTSISSSTAHSSVLARQPTPLPHTDNAPLKVPGVDHPSSTKILSNDATPIHKNIIIQSLNHACVTLCFMYVWKMISL